MTNAVFLFWAEFAPLALEAVTPDFPPGPPVFG
jgi:hypothetical protein